QTVSRFADCHDSRGRSSRNTTPCRTRVHAISILPDDFVPGCSVSQLTSASQSDPRAGRCRGAISFEAKRAVAAHAATGDRVDAANSDHVQHKPHVHAVFGQAPMPEIDELLAGMLRRGLREDAGQASLFVQDAVMFGLSPEFARYLPRSSALRALRENIRAED